MTPMRMHTFVAYVEDLPGVLNRVSSLFRRRGFNIASLTVGRTDREGVSRMTIMLEADDDTARRVEANLYKLVNMLLVQDLTHEARRRARPHAGQGARRSVEPRAGDAAVRGLPRPRGRRGGPRR